MDRLTDFRHVFAQIVVTRGAARSPALRAAFESVPRHEMVGAGPWCLSEDGDFTPTDDPALVYQDMAFALAPERGLTTGLPSLHARCIEACAVSAGENVVHVGSGMGYFTAILAELVGPNGFVTAFEIDPQLAAAAQVNLRSRSNVRVEARSAVTALDGLADLIYVCAGLQNIPRVWIDALSPRGRIALPLTPGSEEGGMLLLSRTEQADRLDARFICRARFIPCIGAEDAPANERLAAAFRAGTYKNVCALYLDAPPDETCWFAGNGWWLGQKSPGIAAAPSVS